MWKNYYIRNTVCVAAASLLLMLFTAVYVQRFEIFGTPIEWQTIRDRGMIRAAVIGPDTLFESQIRLFAADYDLQCEIVECSNRIEAMVMLSEEKVEITRFDHGDGLYSWTVRDSTDFRDTVDLWYDRHIRHISRYDAIFKQWADSTGWDWKLLAAVGRIESHFRNVAGRGGLGIMQLSRATANRFGAAGQKAMKPEQNIAAAARYLVYLESFFPDVEDPDERHKFAIAAYNSGMKAVQSAIALARQHKKDTTRWAEVEPYYRNGHSKHYLKLIMNKYEQYKTVS